MHVHGDEEHNSSYMRAMAYNATLPLPSSLHNEFTFELIRFT